MPTLWNQLVIKTANNVAPLSINSSVVVASLNADLLDGQHGAHYLNCANFTGSLGLANGGTGAATAAAARTNLGLAIGTNVQAWDGDLDAIAALAGTAGFLKKTAANTWALDSTAFVPPDGTGATGTWAINISGSAASAASATTANAVPWSGVTGKPTTLSGFGITDALSLGGGALTGPLTSNSKIETSGSVIASTFTGAGTGLTGTAAALSIGGSAVQLNGQNATFYQNASNLNAGTIPSARLPVPLQTALLSTTDLAAGWYTIATNVGNRASARFIVTDTTSSLHQAIHFIASHHFGTDGSNLISVLQNSWYANGGPVRYIRIKEGTTYQGALLQINLDAATTGLKIYMLDNTHTDGWTLLASFVPDGTDPGGVANFAGLTNVAGQVDLNASGVMFNTDIYIGGATAQSLALHAGNYTSYTPSLLGAGASGTWAISISGTAANASQLGGYSLRSAAHWWGVIPLVGADGVMDIGRYIDFHNSDADGNDYSVRLETGATTSNLTINGSTILHSSNYSSYALPIAGGSLTGNLAITGTGNVLNLTANWNSAVITGNWNGNGYWGIGSDGTHTIKIDQVATTTSTAFQGATDIVLKLGTKTVVDSSNVSSYALPLAGGTLTGKIVAGSASSTLGSVIIEGTYDDGALAVFGTYRSSGGAVLSYGLRPRGDAAGYASSTGINVARGAFRTEGNVWTWEGAGASATAIGTAITVTKYMELTGSNLRVYNNLQADGNLTVLGTGSVSGALSATSFSGAGTGLTGTASALNVGGRAGELTVFDTRGSVTGPGTGDKRLRADFVANSTDGLADGGTYHGVLTFQQWGDASGGGTRQLGFTDNDNLWIRGSGTGLSAYGAWKKILHDSNYNAYAPSLTGAGASGSWGISVTGTAAALSGGDGSFYGLLYNSLAGDLNTYNSPGLYSAEYTGSSNRPWANAGHFIQISDAGGTDVKTQWYSSSDGNKIAMRIMWGNTNWFSWKTLLHDGNYSSYALPLSGGTVTGNITISPASGSSYLLVNRPTLAGAEVGVQLQTAGTSKWWMYLAAGNDTTLRWYSGGYDRMTLTNADLRVFNNLQADGNLTILGTAAITGAITAAGGSFSGTLSIDTSGSNGTTSTVTIKRSGQSVLNFGQYPGAWRSALQIQSNLSNRMLFLVPPEDDSQYGLLRSVNGGLKIDVGGTVSNQGTNAITIDTSGNVGLGVGPSAKLDVRGNSSGPKFISYHTGSNGTVTAGTDLNEIRCDDTTTAYNLLNINIANVSKFLVNSSGNVGIGVAPNSDWTSARALQLSNGAVLASFSGGYTELGSNWYYGSGNKYIANGAATLYEQGLGAHKWYNAPTNSSGAGASITTLTQAMTLDASGNVCVGIANPFSAATGRVGLSVNGTTSSIIDIGVGGVRKAYLYSGGDDIYLNANAGNFSINVESAKQFEVKTNNLTRLTIDSSGNSAWYSGGYTRMTLTDANLRVYNNIQADGALTVLGAAAITGAITQNGNQVLHAANYTSYVLPSYTPTRYTLANTSTATYLYFGRWSNAAQSGQKLSIKVVGAAGYNASANQNQLTELLFKTSNADSSQTGSTGVYYADGSAYRIGPESNAPAHFRVVAVNSTTYDVYGFFGGYPGDNGTFYVATVSSGTWTHSGTLATPSGNYIDITPSAILHSGNYNSYSPTLTGTGASGTWGISVTGNAATATTSVRLSDASSGIRIANPGGASYATTTAAVTGAIKIKLPTAAYKSNTMLRFTVRIYQYAGGTAGLSRTLEVGGYNYSDAAASWYNYFAYQTTMGGGEVNVRFGNDGASNCVWIGDTNTVWDYPQVAVVDFHGGYSNATDAIWGTGWAISFVTAFDTVHNNAPIVAGKPLNTQNYGGYSNFSGSVNSGYGTFASPGLCVGDANYGFYVASGNLYYKSGSGGIHYWRNIANNATLMSLNDSSNLRVFNNFQADGNLTILGSAAISGAITQNGNQVLHAGNYTSYAMSVYGQSHDAVSADSLGTTTSSGGIYTIADQSAGSFTGGNDTLFHMPYSNTTWAHQLAFAWNTQRMGFRTKKAGTWTAWSEVLHSGNYTTYAIRSSGGTAVDVSNTSLDTLTTTGFWRGNTMTGAPDTGWWYIIVESHDLTGGSGWVKQTVTAYGAGNSYSGGTTFIRTRAGGSTWGAWVRVLDGSNYNSYAPSLTGTGASGTWGISVTGSAAAGARVGLYDGTGFNLGSNSISTSGGRGVDLAPNTYVRQISFEFKNGNFTSFTGNYAGLITIAPWDGTTSSTGDSNYQMLFSPNGAANSTKPPVLRLRAGIDTTWGSWVTVARKYNTSITGTGYATSFTITHNLGSKDVCVNVYNSSDVIATSGFTITATSNDVTTVTFSVAPSNGTTYRVVVVG